MTAVIFHRLAIKEYFAARKWYAARSLSASFRFRLAVDTTVNRIAHSPDSAPTIVGTFRSYPVPKFPYILVFKRQTSDSVMVVAVAHTKRRPEYWKRRKI